MHFSIWESENFISMFLPQEILVSLFRCFVQPSSRVVNHGDSEHIFAGEVKMMEYDEQVYSLPIAPMLPF